MKLIRQTANLGEVLAGTLTEALRAHHRVIWLVPGGSNVAISIEASRLLEPSLTDRLVIMQTDERFVAPDDLECNWHQLMTGGLMLGKATAHPVITDATTDIDTTVADYQTLVEREFAQADCIVGQFGVGADGHIAGIKPRSLAAASHELVAGYQAEDFTRITLTFPALRQVTIAETFAFGDAKRPVLEQLAGDSPPPIDFPAGILRETTISTVYNDQIEN